MTAKNPYSFSASLTLLHILDNVLHTDEIKAIGIDSKAQLLTCITEAVYRKFEKLPPEMQQEGPDVGTGSNGILLSRKDVISLLNEIIESKAGVDLALYSPQNLVIAALRHLLQDVGRNNRNNTDIKGILEVTIADIKTEYKRLYGAKNDNS